MVLYIALLYRLRTGYLTMTTKAPSNPSPFTAELQSFVVSKFDPLLSIVKDLNDRLQASDKDRFRLEQRVAHLERQIKAIEEAAKSGRPITELGDALAEGEAAKSQAVDALLEGEDGLSAPWLFSCQTATPTSVLQLLLEFNPESTEELDTRHWRREEDMWVSFLEYLPDDVAVRKPDTLGLTDLRKAARRALLQLCRSELLLILRNVPGKEVNRRQAQILPVSLSPPSSRLLSQRLARRVVGAKRIGSNRHGP